MGVKGTKTMFEIAKAIAIECTPKEVYNSDKTGLYFGYALFPSEYRQVFYENGFVHNKAIARYIDIWIKCDWVIQTRGGVIFFKLSAQDTPALIYLQDRYNDISKSGENYIFIGSEAVA